MRITGIEPVIVQVNQRGDWVFLRVHTDQGFCGLGEASHSLSDALLVAVVEQFAQQLAGRDPLRIAETVQLLQRGDQGRVEHTAISAIEQALWDIVGQALGAPIRTLLGGALRERVRLYANINRHVRERTAEGFATAASQAVTEGFTAIKLAPFDELRSPDHVRTGPRAAWRSGIERVRAVRQAIGDEIELMVDCHGRMETSEALLVARELADVGLAWYEEPVPHTYPDELARITRSIGVPTASAESVYGVEGFAPFLRQRVVDVIMPDVKHDGGILATAQIAAAARVNHLLVAPHNPAGPVSTAATAQVASTLPNFLILEYAWSEAAWRAQLLDPPERIVDGCLLLPEGPGLGHRLNDEVVAAHRAAQASAADSTKVRVG
jgi:galactonate dehydratase